MKDNTYYKSCQSCGRPQTYCKGECCGKPQGCQCKEYGPKACGCIRQKAPECPYEAVIPSVTVESISNLKDLADCFVHVSDINTTFYIDDKHRIMTTWAGLVSVDDYDFEANPLNLRGQIAYDAKNNKAAIYDKQGANYIFQISDIDNNYLLLENKPQINGVELSGNKTSADLNMPKIEEVAMCFDTVSDMKASALLKNGGYARTLGFHTLNDGGGAIYKISDTGTADEMEVIAIGDLFANLVLPAVVNPEIFGAYGDETHDDTDAIQKAINSEHPVVMGKKYLITPIYIGNQDPSITRGWKENISIDASGAKFTYTGGGSAFVLAGIQGADIKIGRIDATNGTCIEMWSTNGNVRIAYLTFTFNQLNAGEKAIYIHPTTGSSGTGFINEVDINGGTIYSGDYGVYVDSTNASSGGISGHRYNGVAFEGCDVCFYGKVTNGELRGFTFNDVRYVENDSAPIFVLDGNILNFNVNSWGRLYPSRLDLTNATVSQFSIKAPIALTRNTSTIGSGLYIDGTHINYLNDQYSSKTLTNATGASGSTVITNQNNKLALNFVGVYGTAAVQTLVAADNSPCKPIRRVYTTLTSSDGSVVGRASIETDGEIKLSCATVGTALYGSLSFISDDIKKF